MIDKALFKYGSDTLKQLMESYQHCLLEDNILAKKLEHIMQCFEQVIDAMETSKAIQDQAHDITQSLKEVVSYTEHMAKEQQCMVDESPVASDDEARQATDAYVELSGALTHLLEKYEQGIAGI